MMNIQECAKQTGCSKDTLRYYDQHHIVSPKRNSNQYRDYSNSDIRLINTIQNLKLAGLKLVEIKMIINLMNSPISESCKESTLSFLQEKRQLFQAKAQFYQSLDLIAQGIETSARQQAFANVPHLIQKISLIGNQLRLGATPK